MKLPEGDISYTRLENDKIKPNNAKLSEASRKFGICKGNCF